MVRKWKNPATCERCGKTFLTRRTPEGTATRYCSRRCANLTNNTGERNPRWRGGRSGDAFGYEWVALPEDQRDRRGLLKGKYQREHVFVAERELGERLEGSIHGDVVHHINTDKKDNRPGNLAVCSGTLHRAIHFEMSRRWQQEHFPKGAPVPAKILDLRGWKAQDARYIVDEMLRRR